MTGKQDVTQIKFPFLRLIIIFALFVSVVQWIECQIPVLMMGVRIPSGTLKMPLKDQKKLCKGNAVVDDGIFCVSKFLWHGRGTA